MHAKKEQLLILSPTMIIITCEEYLYKNDPVSEHTEDDIFVAEKFEPFLKVVFIFF